MTNGAIHEISQMLGELLAGPIRRGTIARNPDAAHTESARGI